MYKLKLTEPTQTRYVHLNPETNLIHLFMPCFSIDFKGQDRITEFFNGGALYELTQYKSALELDIRLIEAENPQSMDLLATKRDRLAQIETYIKALGAMKIIPSLDSLNDQEKIKETVTFKNADCFDFAKIADEAAIAVDPLYFRKLIADPVKLDTRFSIEGIDVNVSPATIAQLNDVQLKLIPEETINEVCKTDRPFELRYFLLNVANGRLDKVEHFLKDENNKYKTEHFLQAIDTFSDNAGHTFSCTAFDYAYWSKDALMCKLLLDHMNEETKNKQAERIQEIEQKRLVYNYLGLDYRSAHFDFTPFKNAVKTFIEAYHKGQSNELMWLAIGKEQRKFPAHVAFQLCCPYSNDSFRDLKYYNSRYDRLELWFPNDPSTAFGLGFDFTIVRGKTLITKSQEYTIEKNLCHIIQTDLAVIETHDEKSTQEIEELLTELNRSLHHSIGMTF